MEKINYTFLVHNSMGWEGEVAKLVVESNAKVIISNIFIGKE